jgi:predicted Zn-dependent protease
MKSSLQVTLGLAPVLASLIVLASCATEPITGRRQLNMMSSSEEMQLGLTTFDQMKKDQPVSKEPSANALLQRVGKRIASAAQKDLPNAQWEFVVFESPEANAFCLPGGKIGVYTGILPITKDEAGLATVLGHEVAHAAAHHGGERMTQARAAQTVGQGVGALSSKADPKWQAIIGTAYGVGAQVGVLLPYSRLQETSADEIGLVYMARAGYNPEEAVHFWERFAEHNKASSGGGLAFLRTHPLDSKRIEHLKEWLPRAKQEYRPQ